MWFIVKLNPIYLLVLIKISPIFEIFLSKNKAHSVGPVSEPHCCFWSSRLSENRLWVPIRARFSV